MSRRSRSSRFADRSRQGGHVYIYRSDRNALARTCIINTIEYLVAPSLVISITRPQATILLATASYSSKEELNSSASDRVLSLPSPFLETPLHTCFLYPVLQSLLVVLFTSNSHFQFRHKASPGPPPRSSRSTNCWRFIGLAPTPCFCTGVGCRKLVSRSRCATRTWYRCACRLVTRNKQGPVTRNVSASVQHDVVVRQSQMGSCPRSVFRSVQAVLSTFLRAVPALHHELETFSMVSRRNKSRWVCE
jgi:hypothetical protein